MTNYKDILRLYSLGINNTRVAESCSCARSTVISTVQRAREEGINWEDIRSLGEAEVARRLYPATSMGRQYKMPDYEYIHQEMQKSGVTLSLLWVECCEQCRTNGELPYQSTQFKKYYTDFVHNTKATMRLEHKPRETMQIDWAGQTSHIVDTDTGEELDAYLFVAVLPYSGYTYTEAFLDMKQDAWITAHVNAYRFFGGTRIASHPRLLGHPNQYSTNESHMPPEHQEYLQRNGERFLRWARQVGPNTTTVVKLFLSAYKVEQQGYKSCMALLKSADKYSSARLEAACKKALAFTPAPSLKSIQSILKSGQDKLPDEDDTPTTTKASQYNFTRGAGYYRRDK